MLGVLAAPSALFFLLLFPTPESPRWLIGRGRTDEARAVLTRLGVDRGGVDREVAEIRASIDPEHHKAGDSLFRPAYRKPVLLAVAIAAFNQLSGINAILYYAPQIFKMAGANVDSALLQAVAVGGTNLVFTMLAMTHHRPLRPPPPDAGRLGRLPHQPGDDGLGVLHLRDELHADGQRRRPGRPACCSSPRTRSARGR